VNDEFVKIRALYHLTRVTGMLKDCGAFIFMVQQFMAFSITFANLNSEHKASSTYSCLPLLIQAPSEELV
jgi:hypothetical protein